MMPVVEDKIKNFVQVKHTASGAEFLMHQSFIDKLGLKEKIQVYELPLRSFIPPNQTYPKGKYISRVKYFLGSFLANV